MDKVCPLVSYSSQIKDNIYQVENIIEYFQLINNSPCIIKFAVDSNDVIDIQFRTIANDLKSYLKCVEIKYIIEEIMKYENIETVPLFLFYLNGKRIDKFSINERYGPALDASVKIFMGEILRNS